MKVLIIDQMGCLHLDFALRCMDAGHKVKVFCPKRKDGGRFRTGEGLTDRVNDWEAWMKWADLVFICDNTKYIYKMDEYHKKGFPIFAGNHMASQWELNRITGDEVFKRAGIETIPTHEFTKYDDAIKFVKENKGRYASKPNGDADKALSYCGKNAADLVYMLEKWKKSNKLKDGFILQEFRPGIEMAVGGWFGTAGFSKHFLENWEYKKLMNDDLGVATGEQGTIMRYVSDSLLADKVLKPLEGMLHGIDYLGYVDVNCIITDDGTPWPLEFTMRPGWPLFQIQQALHKGDPCEWMCSLMNGEDTLKVSNDIACGVVLSIPDYPYNKLQPEDYQGYPIYGVERDELHNVHLSEAMWGRAPAMVDGTVKERDLFVTSGNYVLTTSGTGPSVEKARERAYKLLDKIEVPNSPMWRTDIGKKLEKQIPKLSKMGYVKGMKYE